MADADPRAHVDQQSYERLVRRARQLLAPYGLAHWSEDAAQDSWVDVDRTRVCRGPETLVAWKRVIFQNCVDLIRKCHPRRNQPLCSDGDSQELDAKVEQFHREAQAAERDVVSAAQEQQCWVWLRPKLASMEPHERDIFWSLASRQETDSEIAARLGLSRGKVRRIYAELLRDLQIKARDWDPDNGSRPLVRNGKEH